MALKAKGYNEFIRGTKDDLRTELAEKKAIDDDLKAKQVQAIEEFKINLIYRT